MTVEDLIKITTSSIRLYPESHVLKGMGGYSEPIYEGTPEDTPYKLVGFEVLEVSPANYVLEARVKTHRGK